MVDLAAAGLLGRHVGCCAHDHARLGQEHPSLGFRPRISQVALNELRQSEVEDLHPTVGRHDDVGGLDVAVDDAGRMRGGQRTCQLLAIAERLEQGEPLRGDEPVQRLAAMYSITRKSIPVSCTMSCSVRYGDR